MAGACAAAMLAAVLAVCVVRKKLDPGFFYLAAVVSRMRAGGVGARGFFSSKFNCSLMAFGDLVVFLIDHTGFAIHTHTHARIHTLA